MYRVYLVNWQILDTSEYIIAGTELNDIFLRRKNDLSVGLLGARRPPPRPGEVPPIHRTGTHFRSVRCCFDRAADGALGPTEPRKIAAAAKTVNSNFRFLDPYYGPVISADSLAQGVGGGRGSKKSKIENPYG